MTPLKVSILKQQEHLHDVMMECFIMIQKMANKVKMVEKNLEIVSQTNQRMRSRQVKIEDLDKLRSMENNVSNNLSVIEIYDIRLHTFATTECQDLASRFPKNVKQNIIGMMELYEKYKYDIQSYIQWPKINFKDEHLVPFFFFQNL